MRNLERTRFTARLGAPLAIAIASLVLVAPAGATSVYAPVLTFKGTETPPGAFGAIIGLAVDADPSSPSHGDLYTTDKGAKHEDVSKFTFPSATTQQFSCVLNGLFLGLATTPCEPNTTAFTASLTSGSTTLTAVSGFSGSVTLNATVSGTGIPTGTTIASIDAATGELTLSAAATTSGSGVSLTAVPGFTQPSGVTVNEEGDVWVANEKGAAVIDEFSPAGAFIGTIGESLLAGQTPATLGGLRGIAAGPSGELYVDDATNKVIDKFVETSPGSGTYEFSCHLNASGTTSSLCGGAGTTTTTAFATLTYTNALAVDSLGNVYVVNAGTVDKFDVAGGFLETVGSGSGSASAVAVDPATDNLYVGYGSKIVEYCEEAGCATPGGALDEFGSGTLGGSGTSGLAVSGATQHIRVYAGDGSAGKDDVSVFELQIAPTAATETCPAAGRKQTELELRGTVDPEGFVATSQFEYGESLIEESVIQGNQLVKVIRYPFAVASTPANDGSGDSPVPVSATATGLIPHTLYHYRLQASNSEQTSDTPDETCETLIAPPAVNDAPVAAVSIPNANGAPATTFLSGTLNPENDPTTYHFIYGSANASENSTPITTAGQAYGDEQVEQTLEDLQPAAEYHFALVAENEAGMQSISKEGTFVTQPEAVAPAVVTGGAEGVSGEAATVTGTVDPQGLTTSYRVEFGPTASYGTEVFGEAGSGTAAVPVSIALQALSPDTTYHYRLVAINAGGTTYGADQTFTTPAGPSLALVQPLTPVLLETPTLAQLEGKPNKPTTGKHKQGKAGKRKGRKAKGRKAKSRKAKSRKAKSRKAKSKKTKGEKKGGKPKK